MPARATGRTRTTWEGRSLNARDDILIQPAAAERIPAGAFQLRKPVLEDAAAIARLIGDAPPLDLNSTYAYLLLCRHFSDTCVVASRQGHLAGFVSAYLPPHQPDVLFVWQVAVHPDVRGRRLGLSMLEHLLARPRASAIRYLETTVSPSNQPSRGMFAALARNRGVECVEQPMFPPELFGGAEHEDERLLRLGPF